MRSTCAFGIAKCTFGIADESDAYLSPHLGFRRNTSLIFFGGHVLSARLPHACTQAWAHACLLLGCQAHACPRPAIRFMLVRCTCICHCHGGPLRFRPQAPQDHATKKGALPEKRREKLRELAHFYTGAGCDPYRFCDPCRRAYRFCKPGGAALSGSELISSSLLGN